MSYEEKRVYTKDFGTLPTTSPLLTGVPTAPGHAPQRLHVLAAAAMKKLSDAVKAALGFDLAIASGWREHRWASFAQYQQVLIQKYGSVEKGRLFLAFDSPHETGLAMDIGVGGLQPVSATRDQQ